MKLVKEEVPLGGGEGSVIYYMLQIGNCQINVAESRAIKFSPVQKKWVKELDFLDDFKTLEDVKEALEECEDERLSRYMYTQLADLLYEVSSK